jgi:hypothetical protein
MAATGIRPGDGFLRATVRLLATASVAAAVTVSVAGCDYFAEKKLVVGQHTEQDVRQLMGVPDLVWEEENGAKKLEYPRGPMGTQTYFVHIGPDGRYLGMERALVDSNFAKVKVGMSQDDVRRILGRQTETTPYALSGEEVWSWRYEGDAQATMFFNVHFDQATRRVKRITRIEDWRTQGAP